ncbi:MAG TPA: amidohydrolase family protein [Flavitalea sp.]|nr:amidohydrolase family protein [Flavitalea sp.]
MRLFFLYLLVSALLFQSCSEAKKESAAATSGEDLYTADDFKTIEKIDAHVHVNTYKSDYVQQAAEDNFRLITINLDDVNEPPPMQEQQKFALQQVKMFPDRIAYATTFSIRNFDESDWQTQTISYLKNSFAHGAVAVKIYKVIGLSLRDKTGKLVMIDDPRFDTVINFIVQNKIPVLGHLAEPKNCWLPAEKMTINGDRNYFTHYPMYHMYLHPEFPSYEAQIAARDHMLERYPDLKFIGAHLGSLEWNVDELAKRLDKFPNMAVDMAARIVHLEYQASDNWQKVHDFMIKYQDRLLYATDGGIEANADINKNDMHSRYVSDWAFFTSGDTMTSKDFKQSFKGLKLPRQVIDKIYRTNAEKWFPGISTFKKKTSA